MDLESKLSNYSEIIFLPIYLVLCAGPFFYLLKNWNSPASFLLDFSMILFTAGMFALLIDEEGSKFQGFDQVGRFYLMSGASALTVLFVIPYVKGSESGLNLLPGILEASLSSLGSLIMYLIFISSLVACSVSFGVATIKVIRPSIKEVLGINKDS